MKSLQIVVIGGGMAGTAAANRLVKLGHSVTIIEKNSRLGGRIHSISMDGVTFETGAGFITDMYTNTLAFLDQTGLRSDLQIRKSKSAIIKNKRLYKLSQSSTLLGNKVFPFSAKREIALLMLKFFTATKNVDTQAFWRAYPYDTKTVSELFKERESELLNYFVQPMLGGYFYWSAEKTSQAMLFILLKAMLQRGQTYIAQNGLQRIPETAAKGSTVLLSHVVEEVKKKDNTYIVHMRNANKRKEIKADAIVCATTATQVQQIFKNLTQKQQAFFAPIKYSSTAVLAQIYHPTKLPSNYAIGYPRIEKTSLDAITIASDFVNATLPTTLVKMYANGEKGKEICSTTDKEIERSLLKAAIQIKSIFGVSKNSYSTYIQRWPEAIPEFEVGHFKRLKKFTDGEIESKEENIVFAGDYIGGPFIEGAFTSGIQAAERLQKRMGY